MKVYVFGNKDLASDNAAFLAAKKLTNKNKDIEFEEIKPNEDLPFVDQKFVVILDVVQGINEVIEFEDLDKLILSQSTTVHDFDLGYQLKYLKKIGHLGRVVIIGLPMEETQIDYLRIQSILRKLVAQDIQGS
jgi:Ni,Fe-hydrogenase maturation factor